MLQQMKELGVSNHKDINKKLSNEDAYKRARPSHVTLIVQNQEGLKISLKLLVHHWSNIIIVHLVFQDLYLMNSVKVY